MLSSHVNRIPDFAQLDIPGNCLSVKLSDRRIFRDVLNAARVVEPASGPAQKGDYVLVEIPSAEGAPRKRQIALGSRRFPEYENALTGCEAGQTLDIRSGAGTVPVRVLSVKRPRELELTDENIAALAPDGIRTLGEYRRNFIEKNGREIAADIFQKILSRLLDQLADTMDCTLDEDEVSRHNDQQREMIDTMFQGHFEERIVEAYSGKEKRSLEECEALFARDNRRTFMTTLLGIALARRDGREISEEEMAACLENAALMFEKTEEEMLREPYIQCVTGPFYMQYAIGALRDYFLSRVHFITEER